MTSTDFPNGLSNASQYLNPQNSLNTALTGSVADIERFIIPSQIENTLKEIICSLLAGRGLKLPNIQICINFNLNGLISQLTGLISQALATALGALQSAFTRFMDHLNLNEILGRINGIIGQISNIANMINFCSAPIDPIQIPNVLENAMGSFLGRGMEIMNRIGQISGPNIGICLGDGFNGAIWDGGILREIADNIDDLGSIEDSLIAEIEDIVADIEDLIDTESNVPTTYDDGGSDLADFPRSTWDGIGALYNASDEGITGAVSNGSALWTAYQQLGSYQVQDSSGRVYNNIFELFVDDDLLRVLRRTPNPIPEISTREPVYNYCGEIIGYTQNVRQAPPQRSVGSVPEPINQPGFNAGGLPTNPLNEAINTALAGAGGTVINEINNTFPGSSNNSGTAFDGTVLTSDGTLTEILFDSTQTPTTNKAWFVTVTAMAKRTNGTGTLAIKTQGIVDNTNDSVTVLDFANNTTRFATATETNNYTLLVDTLGNQMRIRVQGDVGHDVSWRVRVEYIEA